MKNSLLLLILCFAPALAQGSSIAPVTGGDAPPTGHHSSVTTAAAANIGSAIDFIESMGDKETATRLRAQLQSGDLSVGSVDGNAETGITGHTTVDRSLISTTRVWDASNVGQWTNIVGLARTLSHENVHTEQSSWQHYCSHSAHMTGGDHSIEIEAWHDTFGHMQGWVDRLETTLDNASGEEATLDATRRLRAVIGLFRDAVRDYCGNEYGEDTGYLQDVQDLLQRRYDELSRDIETLETPISRIERGTMMNQGRDENQLGVFHATVDARSGGGFGGHCNY